MQASYLIKFPNTIYINNFSSLTPNGILSRSMGAMDKNKLFSFNDKNVSEDLSNHIGSKGFRFHDRSSKLCLVVAKKCLESHSNSENVSVIVGSNGALQSQASVVEEAIKTPQFMNPKSYPNRGCNVIAGQISLMFGLRGESTVISNNMRSGIDSIIYGVRKINQSNNPCLVVAGEAISDARNVHTSFFVDRNAIEGAVAVLLSTKNDLDTDHSITVEGYLQAGSGVVNYQDIVDEIKKDFSIREEELAIVYETQKEISFKTNSFSISKRHELFGATTLLGAVEMIASFSSDDRISYYLIVCVDYKGCISCVLLKRNSIKLA